MILKIQVIKQSTMVQVLKTKDPGQSLKQKFAFNILGGILKKMNQRDQMEKAE